MKLNDGVPMYYVTLQLLFLPLSSSSQFPLFSSSTVLCPDQPNENYCDCRGDCTGQPQWCSCDQAQKCCEGAKPTVLCPNQPRENYCDCAGDCKEKTEWCACDEAQKCCNGEEEEVVSSTTDVLKDVEMVFLRFAGSDGTMNSRESKAFFNHFHLLSCNTTLPGVQLMLKNPESDNYADCKGEYVLLKDEEWNRHKVYVNVTKDRMLMFRWGSWLVTGYHWWPEFKRTGGEGMGGGFQQSKLGKTDSVYDSLWDNYDVIPIEVPQLDEGCIEIWNTPWNTNFLGVDEEGSSLSFEEFLMVLEDIVTNEGSQVKKADVGYINTVDELYDTIVAQHKKEEESFCHCPAAADTNTATEAEITIEHSAAQYPNFLLCGVVFVVGILIGMSFRKASNGTPTPPIAHAIPLKNLE